MEEKPSVAPGYGSPSGWSPFHGFLQRPASVSQMGLEIQGPVRLEDRHTVSQLTEMISSFQEGTFQPFIVRLPRIRAYPETREFELGGQRRTAFRPDEGHDGRPVHIAELQGQEESHTHDQHEGHGNEDHDAVGQQQPLPDGKVTDMHANTSACKVRNRCSTAYACLRI